MLMETVFIKIQIALKLNKNMKNLITLLAIITFLGACSMHKSKNEELRKLSRYKPLEKFNGDTLAFVQQSILNRKKYYIGKNFSVFLKDYNMPISIFLNSQMPKNVNLSDYIILKINNYFIQQEKLNKGEDPLTITIVWKEPLDYYIIEEIAKKSKHTWTTEVEKYLNNKIVGDIVKTDYKLNKK